jgi:hypothetical protein
MKILATSPECELRLDEQVNMMLIEWKDKLFGHVLFRQHLELFAQQALYYKPSSLLVDARQKNYVVTPEMQRWHDQHIVPLYLQAGIRVMAFVRPEKLFTELTTRKIFEQDNASTHLPVSFFEDLSKAQEWLRSMTGK